MAERRIHSLSTEVADKRKSFHVFGFHSISVLAVTVFGVQPRERKERERERDAAATKGLSSGFLFCRPGRRDYLPPPRRKLNWKRTERELCGSFHAI